MKEMKYDWEALRDNEIPSPEYGKGMRSNQYISKRDIDNSVTPITSDGIDIGESYQDRTVDPEKVANTLEKVAKQGKTKTDNKEKRKYEIKNQDLYNHLRKQGFDNSEAMILDFMYSLPEMISNKEFDSVEEFKSHYQRAVREGGKLYSRLQTRLSKSNPKLKQRAEELYKDVKNGEVNAVAQKYKEMGYNIKD